MKVLFVQKEGGIFGAENYHLTLIPGLKAKGINVAFLRLYTSYQGGKGGEFIQRLNKLKVKTYEINIGKYPKLKTLLQIKKVVKNGNYDIVHTHLIHADFHLALIKSLFGLRTILVSTKHGYDNNFTARHGFDATKQTNTPYFLISRWAEKRMDASFTVSQGLRNFFRGINLTQDDKMDVIHLGFDIPDNYLKKGNSNFRKANKQITIAGRLVGFKGHEFLIEAMKIISENFVDVKLLIAGTGILETKLKSQVETLGLSGNVDFLGYSQDVGAYMANSDVVIVPSISEGFGVVFLEAFSAKTPVVAWDVPAGNELMKHGESGYLVRPYDTKKLADQIIEILKNENKQGSVVECAYIRLKRDFNQDRMVNETISFYENARTV